MANRDEVSGKQPNLAFDLDTSALSPGFYLLRLTSSGKTNADTDLTIYPADPKITNQPLTIAGEGGEAETLTLEGTGLEWICGISSDRLTWKLHQGPSSCELDSWPSGGAGAGRTATVTLNGESDFKQGDCLPFELQLLSRTGDRRVSGGCVEVVGPRPSIEGHDRLLPPGAELGLQEGEVPAGVPVGFTFEVKNLGSPPSLELGCSPTGKPFSSRVDPQGRAASRDGLIRPHRQRYVVSLSRPGRPEGPPLRTHREIDRRAPGRFEQL